MAAGCTFRCSGCARAVTAWDEGNPYFRDDAGQKVYVYHPSPDVVRCTGNDSPRLCLACGAEAMSDSAAPLRRCPACSAHRLVDTWQLAGRPCPYCRQGTFDHDPHGFAVS